MVEVIVRVVYCVTHDADRDNALETEVEAVIVAYAMMSSAFDIARIPVYPRLRCF